MCYPKLNRKAIKSVHTQVTCSRQSNMSYLLAQSDWLEIRKDQSHQNKGVYILTTTPKSFIVWLTQLTLVMWGPFLSCKFMHPNLTLLGPQNLGLQNFKIKKKHHTTSVICMRRKIKNFLQLLSTTITIGISISKKQGWI